MLKLAKWLLRQVEMSYQASADAEWDEYLKYSARSYKYQAQKWSLKAQAVSDALKTLEGIE